MELFLVSSKHGTDIVGEYDKLFKVPPLKKLQGCDMGDISPLRNRYSKILPTLACPYIFMYL